MLRAPGRAARVNQPPSRPYSSRNTARRAAASRDTASVPISTAIERLMRRDCAGEDLRVEVHGQVDERAWADLLGDLGGSFFHCFEHAAYESDAANARPIFLEAFREDTLVGMAAGILCTPCLPVLRRVCKEAWFNALPATRDHDAIEQEAVLAAFERRLRRLGVFRIGVAGCDSRNAKRVLTDLGYELSGRFEFHLRLSPNVEQNWAALRSERRTKIRRAMKQSLTVQLSDKYEDVKALLDLGRESMLRKGILVRPSDEGSDRLFRNLFETGRAKLVICHHEARPLGALLFGTFDDRACTLMAGSSQEGNQLAVMPLVYWELIRHLTERKILTLNLGGVSMASGQDPKTNSLYAFKKDFGAEAVFQPSGSKTFRGPGSGLDAIRTGVKRLLVRGSPGASSGPQDG